MPDTTSVRMRNLPMILLALAPAMLLTACNRQEKQELAAALARADEAAQRAENAQHAAEAAAARARTDKIAAARNDGPPEDLPKPDNGPESFVAPAPEVQEAAHLESPEPAGRPG